MTVIMQPKVVKKYQHHWHVKPVCISISLPDVITIEEYKNYLEYEKMVKLVGDLTGLEVAKFTDHSATFTDGSKVRWYECDRDCLEG